MDFERDVAFFRLLEHDGGGYKVVVSTLAKRKGVRQRIKPGSSLSSVFDQIPVGQQVVIPGEKLAGLAELAGIADSAACRLGNEIRLAILPTFEKRQAS
jgi:hypothetical protein